MSRGHSIPKTSATTAIAVARAISAGTGAGIDASEFGASCEIDADIGATLSGWRRVSERLESVSAETELSDAISCWLRIGAEPFGASGGLLELRLGGGSGETQRASFGIAEPSARSLSGFHADAGVPPFPSEAEFVADLAESEEFGGHLVRPLLEQDGVRSVVSTPLGSKSGFCGVVRYFFVQRVEPDGRMRALIALLAQRLTALVESRILLRRAQAVESRLHAVLDGAGEGILAIAADGRILEANHAAATIFGYSREELRGTLLAALVPRHHARLLEGDRDVMAASPKGFEFEAQRRDGSEFIADTVVGAAALQHGRTLVIRDASARRTADARMRQCERLASIGTLAAGLGHDLNNTLLPMRARLSALTRFRRSGSASERDAHFAHLRTGLEYLQSLADALHFLASDSDIGVGTATDLAPWWQLTGPLLSKALHDRATLEVAIESELPRVAIDEHSLTRAALGILVNAGEAMPRERPRELARVLLRAFRADDGRSVVVEFADNGVGMTDETRRRAFDAYFTTKTRAIGTGLGLPIVRSIIERAGGRVELDTSSGVGTTVRLVLASEPDCDDGVHHGGIAPPQVACIIGDGRLAAVVASLLAAHGVDSIGDDPCAADIWIVSDDLLTEECAVRWCSMRVAVQLVVLSVRQDRRSDAAGRLGATVVSRPYDLRGIEAAIKQALVSANSTKGK